MIDYTTTVHVVIEDVEEVLVEEIGTGFPGEQRDITVRTKHGETFALVLRANEAEKLELKKRTVDEEEPERDWLNPKVYNGAMNDGDASV